MGPGSSSGIHLQDERQQAGSKIQEILFKQKKKKPPNPTFFTVMVAKHWSN